MIEMYFLKPRGEMSCPLDFIWKIAASSWDCVKKMWNRKSTGGLLDKQHFYA